MSSGQQPPPSDAATPAPAAAPPTASPPIPLPPPASPTHTVEEIGIKDFIESVRDSSNRGRFALYVVIITGLLMFSGYWNQQELGWIKQRTKVARYAYAHFDELNKEGKDNDDAAHKAAKQYIVMRGFASKEMLQTHLQDLEKHYIDHVLTIRVPMIGIVVDVNDIGMMGGFAFVISMILLRFSLARELSNLVIAFAEAEKRKLGLTCYNLLTMSQVLTVPPHEAHDRSFFWTWIHKILFLIPLIVQSLIIIHDWSSQGIGRSVSDSATNVVTMASAGCWVAILILTWECLDKSIQADKKWHEFADRLFSKKSV